MNPLLIINKENKSEAEIAALPKVSAARAILFTEKNDVVLVSCDSTKVASGRYFGITGGKIEAGENIEEACRREVKEESGFTVSKLTPVGIIFLVQEKYLSVSYGFTARVNTSDQEVLRLTEEEKSEKYAVELLSFEEAVSLFSRQYIEDPKGTTLRNLTFLLEAKRITERK